MYAQIRDLIIIIPNHETSNKIIRFFYKCIKEFAVYQTEKIRCTLNELIHSLLLKYN